MCDFHLRLLMVQYIQSGATVLIVMQLQKKTTYYSYRFNWINIVNFRIFLSSFIHWISYISLLDLNC